jgi:hypothetical protein
MATFGSARRSPASFKNQPQTVMATDRITHEPTFIYHSVLTCSALDTSLPVVLCCRLTPSIGRLRSTLQIKAAANQSRVNVTLDSFAAQVSSSSVRRLRPATSYSCSLRAENEVGLSEPSEPVRITTKPEGASFQSFLFINKN